ncbi:NAD-dependent epimerase/dehydratase family protein [Solihabitans fulvus]|uniref:NAD-dependent epimerase/dehydratase family protein n=1 Tax=Solihabitans fulvus TaxID=1892852 RepID=A0A5B2X9Y3_9PSEU|nr:NAD-dependent epimerase/dehydratase family protein [Solihabitans fulvus]KAA2260458.1 NAD-dependent epimerase/dehydratase family protein [Solihabitans fulvus]
MSFHVVLGSGATGAATARLLADSGEQVRLITRRGTGPEHALIELVAADATDADRLTELVEGADTMTNCAAPPYHRWPAEFPSLAAALLTAAERTGVGYVMLGNTYGYGPVAGPSTEDLPMAPNSAKGRVRAAMWRDALAAHEAGRARVTEVRADTFLGVGALSNFNLMIAPHVLAGEPAWFPADPDAPRTWTCVDDVARALVTIGADERAWGRAWHVPSLHLSARHLADRLAELAGSPAATLHRMTDQELDAMFSTNEIMAELREMQYLLADPSMLDSTVTERTFGLRATQLDDVLKPYLA